MTAHTHSTIVDSCFRCDLNRGELGAENLCPVTDIALGVCTCDQCMPEAHAVATHTSLCGWCTGNIRQGDRIVKPAGEDRWWHEECAGEA